MSDERETAVKRSAKRDQIVEAAFNLFKKRGFYATGVDLIMRTAKVSKRTLYKYFPTKNDLIVAVLEYYRLAYKQNLHTLLGQNGKKTSREKIHAIFDDAADWFDDNNFHGCLVVNAMGEFSGKDRAIEDSCRSFKEWELGLLRNLAGEIDSDHPDELACKLFVLLEGMASIAQVTKGRYPVDMTEMANQIIDKHILGKSLRIRGQGVLD